jgi:hypothetical protein
LSARTLSGSWSQRTSYSRVHTEGGFEETIEAAKAAWTRIKKNTALTFEDWLCISMVLVIGQAAVGGVTDEPAIWPALSRRNQRMAQRERSRQASPKGVQRRCLFSASQ